MQTTANLGLKKPEGTDVVNIQDFNDNADLLDTAVAAKETPAAAQAKASTAELNAKAYTDTKVAGLVNSSPATLDTLKELADALGSDPNYAATTATLIGTKAPLASPVLTGTPTAPTAAVDTSTTQVATTAFVLGQAGATTPVMDGTAGVGTSKRYARADHVHPLDTSRAAQADYDAHLADYVRQPGYAVATGSANTYAVTLNPAPTGYTDGMGIAIKISATNTGASTVNVNVLGAKSLKDPTGSDFASGSLLINKIYSFKYDSVSGTFIQQGRGGDPNLVTGNIKSGVSIYGVAGKASVVDTADANAIASQILSGLYAYVNGVKLTGTMPSRAYQESAVGSWTNGAGILSLKMPTGAYVTEGGFGAGYCAPSITDANFIAANIKKDVSIFGLVGTLGYATITIPLVAGTFATITSSSADTSSASYVKLKEFRMTQSGIVRVSFSFYGNDSGAGYARIYKNGVAVGTEKATGYSTLIYTEDFSVSVNDLIQLYAKNPNGYNTHISYVSLGVGGVSTGVSDFATITL